MQLRGAYSFTASFTMDVTDTSEIWDPASICNVTMPTSDPAKAVLDGTFFKYLPEKSSTSSKTVVAVCVKCQPKTVEIKGYGATTSNFISHLKRRHGEEAVEEYRQYLDSKRSVNPASNPLALPVKKQFLQYSMHGRARGNFRQQQFDEDIVKFIIHSMVPLRILEDQYFNSIFTNLNTYEEGVTMMSLQCLSRRINQRFEEQCSMIKRELQETSFVCTTADIWSAKKRCFLGVTVHWITDGLQRKSAALSCRRIRSIHSYDTIIDMLHSIYMDYGISQSKITATLTDNGRNFTKAFQVYGVEHERIDTNEETCSENDNDDAEAESDSEVFKEEETNWMPVLQKVLPAHLRCCAHTLSLCATSDVAKVLETTSPLSLMHTQVMKKCNLLWKASEHSKSAEIIESILGYSLSRPRETKWNSLYDSLKQIIKIRPKSSQLFKALNIGGMLNDQEFDYLEEHLACAQPVAEALNMLQGENNTYFGIVLPCLVALRRKLQVLVQNEWNICKPLSEAYLTAVERRFSDFFNFTSSAAENAAVAALSYPRFKNRWLSCVDSINNQRLMEIFKKAVASEMNCEQSLLKRITISTDHDFFDFGTPSTSNELTSSVGLQVLHFFDDTNQDFDIFLKYPAIKKVFLKYNTPLPSSAPVERLFSFATMSIVSKAHKSSDSMFERRVVLKANLNYNRH